MKIKKSVFAAVMAGTVTVSMAAGAMAASTLQEVKAYLNSGITIKYNGESQVMTDAQGARLYPITYNGSTYVPIRAVSGILGVGVDWDQTSQTVLLGDPADGVDLIDALKAYHTSEFEQVQTVDKKDPKEISGSSYSHWIGIGGAYRGVNGTISFNTEGKYQTLTFKYYSNEDITLEVLGDNDAVLATIPIKGGQVAQSIEVNLLNTTQLTFRNVETMQNGHKLFIFDTKLK